MSIWAESDTPGSSEVCQVVVVGAGPAGSAAAHAAAEAGLEVILIERGDRDRDKACGDMFVPAAVAILQRLGIDCCALRAVHAASSFGVVELRAARGLLWQVRFPAEPIWVIPRRIVDQMLRDSLPSRVRVLYNTTVREIAQPPGDRLWVKAYQLTGRVVSFRCEAIILASGAQGRLSEQWGISGDSLIAPSISAYVRNPGIRLPAFEFLTSCRPGYRWLFPLPDGHANVGICALGRAKSSALKSLGRTLTEAYRVTGEVRWRGSVGGLWSGRGVCWHHVAGVVSCGDAAGLVDPINGEGLTAALASGQAAGNAIACFLLQGRDASLLTNYSKWVRATFSVKYGPSPVRLAWRQLTGISAAHL